MTLFNDFHHGNYAKALSFDLFSVSDEAQLHARIMQYRAQIAAGAASEALTAAKKDAAAKTPDLQAVQALALYVSGNTEQGLKEAEKLAQEKPENPYVQVLAGSVLAASGKMDEALELLAKHQGSLEALALSVQVHLLQNRTDLALKEVQAGKKWAQDNLLINIAESWVGLRIGGDRYQQAFYEFEEMPIAQSIAEIHLGRLPEAEAALEQARKDQPDDAQALANTIVLNVLSGKDASDLIAELKKKAPEHAFLTELKEKNDLFDFAAAKYASKTAA